MAAPLWYQGQSEGLLGAATNRYRDVGLLGNKAGDLWSQQAAPGYRALFAEAAYRPDLVNPAAIDAQTQASNMKGQYERGLSRMGVNPNSGRFAGLMSKWSLDAAAQKSAAMTRAARAEREGQFSKLLSAVGMGNNLLGQGMSGLQAGAGGLMQSAGEYGSLAAASAEQGRQDQGLNADDRYESLLARLSENRMAPATPDAGNQAAYQRMRDEWARNDAARQTWYARGFGYMAPLAVR